MKRSGDVSTVPSKKARLTITSFDQRCMKLNSEIYSICLKTAMEIDVFETVIQEQSLCYLDLAVGSTIGRKWRKYTKSQTVRALPQVCAEFLIAETEIIEFYGRLLKNACDCKMVHLSIFDTILNRLNYEVFVEFSKVFIKRTSFLTSLDSTQRIHAIRGILKLHEMLKIDCFTTQLYTSLMAQCTSLPIDSAPTIDALKTLCNSENLKIRVFMEIPRKCLEILLRHAKDKRFNFWGLWCGTGDLSARFNPILEYFFDRVTHSNAKVLLKYGFRFTAEEKIYSNQCIKLACRGHEYSSLDRYTLYLRAKRQTNRLRITLITQIFWVFGNLNASSQDSDAISTLVHLFRSLPDPYVTPSEMLYELNHALIPKFPERLKEMCDNYATADVHDDDYKVYKPRKLVHLCRCSVRKTLAENFSLPEGTKELGLPKCLEAYLRLEY